MNITTRNDVKSFHIHKIDSLFINNFGKLTLIIIFISLITSFSEKQWSVFIYTTTIIVFIFFVISWFCKTFAQSIKFNANERIIEFCLTRKNGTIKAKYEDITKIYVNGYALFYLQEKRIMFKNLTNSEIFKYIDDVCEISWGPLDFIYNQKAQLSKTVKSDG